MYLKKHWRGEFSLAWSFWINIFAVNIAWWMIHQGVIGLKLIDHPVHLSRWLLCTFLFWVILVYPWQVVGLARSAIKRWQTAKVGPILAIAVIAFSGWSNTQNVKRDWESYHIYWRTGFTADPYGSYRISVVEGKPLIHVQGLLGYGIHQELKAVANSNEHITGIVIDSAGGRTYEARLMAGLVEEHGWNTYSLIGCHSACGLVFAAGTNRYMTEGTRFGFHQYTAPAVLGDVEKEYIQDRSYYLSKNVSKEFVDQIFETPHQSLWMPTELELKQSGFVHSILPLNSVIPESVMALDQQAIRLDLRSEPVFEKAENLTPEFYLEVVSEIHRTKVIQGPEFDVMGLSWMFLDDLAADLANHARDVDLDRLFKVNYELLTKLYEVDAGLCMRALFPVQLGNFDFREVYASEEWSQKQTVFSDVITYGQVENAEAEWNVTIQRDWDTVSRNLGEAVDSLAFVSDVSQYEKVCKAYIRFHEELVALPTDRRVNLYRYLRSL